MRRFRRSTELLALGLLLSLFAACRPGTEGAADPDPLSPPAAGEESDASAGDEAAVDLEAFPADLPMPEDPAPFVGSYGMSSIGANSAIERTLTLNGNLEAMLSTFYVDKSPVPIVESGVWKVSGAPDRPTAIVELNSIDGRPMDSPDVITFELVGPGRLTAIVYNLENYGSVGLDFTRLD